MATSDGRTADGEFNSAGQRIDVNDRPMGPTPGKDWNQLFGSGGAGPKPMEDAATRTAARQTQTWPPKPVVSPMPVGFNGASVPVVTAAVPAAPVAGDSKAWMGKQGVAWAPAPNNAIPGSAATASLPETRAVRFAPAPTPGAAPTVTGNAAVDRANFKAYDAAGVKANLAYFAPGGGRVEAPAPSAREMWMKPTAATSVAIAERYGDKTGGRVAYAPTPGAKSYAGDGSNMPDNVASASNEPARPSWLRNAPGAGRSASSATAMNLAPAAPAGAAGDAGTPRTWADVASRSGKPLLRAPSGEQVDPSNPSEARKLPLSQQLATVRSRLPVAEAPEEARARRKVPPPKVNFAPAARALWGASLPGMATNAVGKVAGQFNDLVLRNENTRDTRWADIVRRSRASGQNPVTAAAGSMVKSAAPLGAAWMQNALGSRLTAEPQRAKPQTLQSPKAVLGL